MNLVLFGVAGLASIEGDSKVQERFYSHNKHSENKVAIINVDGIITDGEGFVKRQIDQAKKDKQLTIA